MPNRHHPQNAIEFNNGAPCTINTNAHQENTTHTVRYHERDGAVALGIAEMVMKGMAHDVCVCVCTDGFTVLSQIVKFKANS